VAVSLVAVVLGCRAEPRPVALDGRPILEEQRRYRRLVGSVDEAWAEGKALRLAVSSPFAPRGGREVAGIAPDVPLATTDAASPAFLDEALAAIARTLAAGGRPIQPGARDGS
jgi:hypothetical protein